MFTCSNGVQIVECIEELPAFPGTTHTLYLDFETTSRDPTKMSVNPWFDCWPCGICIAVDNGPVYYVPVGHHSGHNIDHDAVKAWLSAIIPTVQCWVNHNIKYDAHVLLNGYGLQLRDDQQMIDTIVLAKLYQSDRFTYSLDALMKAWLPEVSGKAGNMLTPYLGPSGNKDYGRIPIDVLGEYGGQDVICTRRLYQFLLQMLPNDAQKLLKIEIGVTAILFDIERLGMRTEPHMLRALNVYYITELLRIEKQIEVATGYSIRPHVNDDCYQLLCDHFGLPVLRWTVDEDTKEEKNASFARDVLFEYLTYPGAPIEIVQLLLQYREMNTFRTLFLDTYLRLNIDGRLHPDINQTVRTGRMSVRRPNSQQLNKTAKKLILPDPGCSFLSVDFSQIEFRLIVHYIQNAAAIKAYNKNPDTDFHQLTADMIHIKRKPAKTVNFAMGYGGGKARLIKLLMKEPELVGELLEQYKDPVAFAAAAAARAEQVYNTYHHALPTLKTTSRAAEVRCRSRGYVFNLFGRRRHLPSQACYRAFNALNQSTAADILKERLIPAWQLCRRHGVRITALVHDEILFHGEHAAIYAALPELIECLEQPGVKLSVPMRCTYGVSDKSWFAAGEPELKWPLEKSTWHHERMTGGGR